MRVVANEKLVKRNVQVGKYASIGGMGLLVVALVVNLLALTRDPAESATLITYVLIAFFAGYTLSNIGKVYNERWARRPDRGLVEALKGLDERYTLYNFRLGAAHVLTGPSGAFVLHPKYQTGPILYDGKRWQNPGVRRGLFGLGGGSALGNPVQEAAGEVQAFHRFLKKNAPDLDVSPEPIIVFMHTRAELSVKDTPVPPLHFKQLKDYIRKLPKDLDFSPMRLAQLVEPGAESTVEAG
jgi:hypothetical protein